MRIHALAATAAMLMVGCSPAPYAVDECAICDRGEIVEAQGRAYVEMLTNRSRFTVTFESKDERSETASAVVGEQANTATEAIRMASDEQVRITSDLSVRPYYSQVTRRTGEHSEQLVENVHPDALLGYVAKVIVNVTVLDPERAAEARGAALAGGPVNSSAMGFYLEPTTENQRAVYEQAVQDAAQRAQLIADASGATLGKLLVLQEGPGPCLGTPSSQTGYAQSAAFDSARMNAGAAPGSRRRATGEAAEHAARP